MWLRKIVHFLPFGYFWQTRLPGIKDFVFNGLSAWVPGWIILVLIGAIAPGQAAIWYAISYLGFTAFYEVGYLANDTIGTRHDETPRKRLKVPFGPFDVVLFVVIRIAVWIGTAWLMGWLDEPIWWIYYATLGIVTLYHNVVQNSAFKAVSFIQMSLLRFVGPVMFFLPQTALPYLFAIGLIAFTYHRFITYLASKGRLDMPERVQRWYYLRISATFAPLSLLLSVAMWDVLPILLTTYLTAIHWLNGYVSGKGSISGRPYDALGHG